MFLQGIIWDQKWDPPDLRVPSGAAQKPTERTPTTLVDYLGVASSQEQLAEYDGWHAACQGQKRRIRGKRMFLPAGRRLLGRAFGTRTVGRIALKVTRGILLQPEN
jgi:hypothetical protein